MQSESAYYVVQTDFSWLYFYLGLSIILCSLSSLVVSIISLTCKAHRAFLHLLSLWLFLVLWELLCFLIYLQFSSWGYMKITDAELNSWGGFLSYAASWFWVFGIVGLAILLFPHLYEKGVMKCLRALRSAIQNQTTWLILFSLIVWVACAEVGHLVVENARAGFAIDGFRPVAFNPYFDVIPLYVICIHFSCIAPVLRFYGRIKGTVKQLILFVFFASIFFGVAYLSGAIAGGKFLTQCFFS